MVRGYLSGLLGSLAASVALAQQPAPDNLDRVVPPDCGSVVIIKCERSPPVATPRRQMPLIQQLDGVVIEADEVRRRSVEEIMGPAFPTARARDGNYTFTTGEGSQCTCMNVCPPFPFPCCNCSVLMNRYRLTPGSSPLN